MFNSVEISRKEDQRAFTMTEKQYVEKIEIW